MIDIAELQRLIKKGQIVFLEENEDKRTFFITRLVYSEDDTLLLFGRRVPRSDDSAKPFDVIAGPAQ